MCIKDPYCRLNRPFVVDGEDRSLGHTGSESESDGDTLVADDFVGDLNANFRNMPNVEQGQDAPRKLRVSI